MSDHIGDLMDDHSQLFFSVLKAFNCWIGLLNPVDLKHIVNLITNTIYFGPESVDEKLAIIGPKFTGKTALSKLIWSFLPDLHIVESLEPVPDYPCIRLTYEFFSKAEQEEYFSMPVQPYFLSVNRNIFLN
jgi:hypothetical protein